MLHKKFPKDQKLDENLIPTGVYCHGRPSFVYDKEHPKGYRVDVCPYWDFDDEKPKQENGYCHFMKKGDWEIGETFLLWDQCKECGINDELEEDEKV